MLREKSGAQTRQALAYDGFGNIRSITEGNVAYTVGASPSSNRATVASSAVNHMSGTYDGAGNMVTAGTNAYTYDALNVMTRSTTDVSRAYVYNANDERIGTMTLTGPGGSEVGSQWTIRDPAGQVLRRFSRQGGQWRWMQDYIYRGGKMLASESNDQLETLHYHLDHLGSPRLITGNGGVEVARHTYYPFGEEVPGATPQVAEPKKFTAHERDGGGLDYMHARYYDYSMGRFLSVDPGKDWDLHRPQSWNLYVYALNNPVNRVDPDGRRSYLVARNGPGRASHMFIVTHARYLGDPNAVVRSWGRSSEPGREGKLGRVGLRTTGMSNGTYAEDVSTWKSFAKTDDASRKTAAQTDYTVIAATDGKVASVADAVQENKRYHLDGPNSNSAAQAVADRAHGSSVRTPDVYDTPTGVDEKGEVTFDEQQIRQDEIDGAHRVHVPPW